MPHELNALEILSDPELIGREAADRRMFIRMPRSDPRALGTTYRVIRVAADQLEAWHRWTESTSALIRRGLTRTVESAR